MVFLLITFNLIKIIKYNKLYVDLVWHRSLLRRSVLLFEDCSTVLYYSLTILITDVSA